MSFTSRTTKTTDPDIFLETDKLLIIRDKYGMYGDVAPSKVAPQYLKDLIDSTFQDQDDLDPPSFDDSFDSSCSRTYDSLEAWKKRIQDEERLSRMYQLRHTFSLRFDNRAWLHPHGTTNFDYKAISEERRENFEKMKNRVRQENYEYLGSHPEIQAIISLAVKKLLQVLPPDPAKFLSEFFTPRMGGIKEFEEFVEAEGRKISKYHLSKMSAAGKIIVRPCTAVRSEISGETWRPEQDANHLKKLNIGALAQDFSFDASSLKHKKKKSGEGEKLKLNKKAKKKCGQRKYCGCKDWKLKKEGEEDQEDVQTTTLSTLGNLNDNMLMSEEEDEETIQFGDGEFLGDMEERVDADRNLTTEQAEMIAGLLVNELLT